MCISQIITKSQGYKDYINTRIKTSIRITIHKHYTSPPPSNQMSGLIKVLLPTKHIFSERSNNANKCKSYRSYMFCP